MINWNIIFPTHLHSSSSRANSPVPLLEKSSRQPVLSINSMFFHWIPSFLYSSYRGNKMSCLMTKPTTWSVHPANAQISLGICPVWSESLLYTLWVAKDRNFLHADNEDSDQTGQMPWLIWVFAGRTDHFVGFEVRWLKPWYYCKYTNIHDFIFIVICKLPRL